MAVFLLGIAVSWGQTPAAFPQTVNFEGRLTFDDYERLREIPFEVPPGTRRIELIAATTGRNRRTMVDIGLRGPSGFRGWSGTRLETVQVSAFTATPGYLPGPIEPGAWAVILGVPNIRKGSEDTYSISITLQDTDLPVFSRVIRQGEGWYAGDLHTHSAHSDGSVTSLGGRRVGGPPHLMFEAAKAAGMDFVTLSDHNTVAHWLEVDRLQPYYDTMLLLHGREVTTYRGHANTVGERRFTDFRLPTPQSSPAPILREITSTGAFVYINHPLRPDDETCMGCGWNLTDDETLGAVLGVEVVNGPLAIPNQYGWDAWASWLNRGFRLTAVGGSDEHTPDEPYDYLLGMPTTVVWARELSEPAIIEGLKSGRVYIRVRGPKGPTLEFNAEVGAASYPMGAVLPSASARVRLRAAVGQADGQTLEWIRNGQTVATDIVRQAVMTHDFDAQPGDWFSLIVRDALLPTLLSNPIYVAR
ncbi:MAG: CehA/McbA family metallohydrolase [Verrucomicrobiae bacterium]|nr:CehA/McbA family metallohydrolase [Verrucomicrobiae bacterium]